MTKSTSNSNSGSPRTFSILRVLFTTILAVALIGAAAWFLQERSLSRQAQKEARNVQLALHLLATEYYGMGKDVYDPSSPDGLAPEAAREIRRLSGAEGTVQLLGWDDEYGEPEAFVYGNDKRIVRYQWDSESRTAAWTVERRTEE